ncbi:hypothetical protein N7532_002064 [Penicillium argentinense]|uniref:Uncharacterized protein n=1 Tax=Penicillium argentinense TaxID=1131581 RepID=A0A9W9G3P9_9EURO|nr:uncharacterized protein N7532_002064 [Penicillium argentinense]KAJ5111529.1 hypothetical protein N7532_002064 [Penicillium argentinense]
MEHPSLAEQSPSCIVSSALSLANGAQTPWTHRGMAQRSPEVEALTPVRKRGLAIRSPSLTTTPDVGGGRENNIENLTGHIVHPVTRRRRPGIAAPGQVGQGAVGM